MPCRPPVNSYYSNRPRGCLHNRAGHFFARRKCLHVFDGNKLESHRHILIAQQVVRDRKDDFDRLAFAHFHELRRVALRVCEDRETADDLVQETYLRAWRSFDKFELGTNCRAWLFRIFFYVRSEYRRSQSRQPLVFSLDYVKESTIPSQTNASLDLSLEDIKRAFAELPEPFRIAVLLSDVEGLRYREIAEVLNVPVGTVMSRLSRGRRMLRARLATISSEAKETGNLEKHKEKSERI
jgi:RNA polymerase sigma-70 factor, ECF subfamily